MDYIVEDKEYLLNILVFGLCSWVVYINTMFRIIQGCTYNECRVILLTMLIFSVAVGFLLNHFTKSGFGSLTKALIIPYGIYTVISYSPGIFDRLKTIGLLSAALVMVLLYIIIFKRPEADRPIRIIKMLTSVFALALSAVVLSLAVSFIIGNSMVYVPKSKLTQTSASGEKYTIDECIETISLLEQEKWEKLDSEAKVIVLNTAMNIEKTYLGLPDELYLRVANLAGDILGQYNDNTKTITIDSGYMATAEGYESLNVICHEVRHAWQSRMLDVYLAVPNEFRQLKGLRDAKDYLDEFTAYSYRGDAYYSRVCEKDCRTYAREGVEKYKKKIQEYVNKQHN